MYCVIEVCGSQDKNELNVLVLLYPTTFSYVHNLRRKASNSIPTSLKNYLHIYLAISQCIGIIYILNIRSGDSCQWVCNPRSWPSDPHQPQGGWHHRGRPQPTLHRGHEGEICYLPLVEVGITESDLANSPQRPWRWDLLPAFSRGWHWRSRPQPFLHRGHEGEICYLP